jgi:hypothetical protein
MAARRGQRLEIRAWKSFGSLNFLKSERTQQNRADEYERREHRQNIELQGIVHFRPPIICRDESLTDAFQGSKRETSRTPKSARPE